ncbi:helix-turn-helix transcriptional regulator [Solemya velum gill symbiont]|uniref:helix-turn-helix transcriptional regulator n=1 Tax=Solemya velum gill symbiont TaxID=2340 RepID=UPI000998140A|nr:AlpA family transcriptional regulator [Solemya velum gill symbiont]OOY45211.1 hypothetical protein BOV93_13515 [Solemya velum gill symbiont]
MPTNRILRLEEVMNIVGLCRSTIYVEMAEGRFPRSVPLSRRAVGWYEEEINDWVDDRKNLRESNQESPSMGD